ncbi:IPT/TIG domain-containing protein [Streptomyces decoyicus]|uniref:IPT/TIG domain-containing protein n=1 Tax=Streptomyces decoyicus TaxID=249567 RepID=UPI003810A431
MRPNQGSTGGGAAVTLTGTGLENAGEVRFGTKSATITANTATSVSVVAPSGAGVVAATVTPPGGPATRWPCTTFPCPSSSTSRPLPGPWRAVPRSPSPGAASPPRRPWRSARRRWRRQWCPTANSPS